MYKKFLLFFVMFLVIGIGCFALVERDNINNNLSTKLEQTEKSYSYRIDELTKYQEGLVAKINELNEKNKKLKESYDALQASYDELDATYKKSIEDNNLHVAALNSQIEEMQKNIAELEKQLQESESENTELKKQVAELKTKVANLEQSINEKNATIEQLNSTIETQKATIENLNKTISDLNSTIEDLTNDLNSDLSSLTFYKNLMEGEVTEITAEDLAGVTKIRDYVFYHCDNLTSVELPKTCLSIGNYAFSYCQKLELVEFSNRVLSIGDFAFADSGLKSIDMSNTQIEEIPESCFYFCTQLVTVSLPQNIISIEDNAFYKCSFKTITLPTSLNYVGKASFAYNSYLTELIFPEDMTTLHLGFNKCASLKYFNIPSNVDTLYVDSYAFSTVSVNSFTLPANAIFDRYTVDGRTSSLELIFDGSVSLPLYSLAFCEGDLTLRFNSADVYFASRFDYSSNIVKIEVPADDIEYFKSMDSLSDYVDVIVAI